MQQLFNFIFDNFLLVLVGLLLWYIVVQYRDLKDKISKIKDLFENSLESLIFTP